MKQIEVTASEYQKIMDVIISKKKSVSDTLIEMIEEASKYKIVNKVKNKCKK